jgi:putative ubiquitin-RnfH superfamily antitoxin RatB of RatAB toxin-antitoxin module
LIPICVIYSPSARQVDHVDLRLAEGSTVADAVAASGLAQRYPEYPERWVHLVAAVWGRLVALDHVVRAGDRVEILRPLQVDPKESRRLRYNAQARPRRQPR